MEGSKYPKTITENDFLKLLNGISLYFNDPKTRSIIKRNIKIALTYSDSRTFEKFLSTGGTSQTKIMAKLIARNWLGKTSLKILDVGSHYGYLIDDLKQYPDLTIDRYVGIDLSPDVIDKAKQRIKNKFEQNEAMKYNFVLGNALSQELYKKLPDDNDIIVFSGLGHMTVGEVKICLSNFSNVLSKEKTSMICLTSTVFEDHAPDITISRNKLSMYFKWLDEFSGATIPNIDSFIETASQHELDLLVSDVLKFTIGSMIQEKEGIEENVLYRLYKSKTSDFDYEYNIKDRCQIEKLLANCGFKIEKERSFINPTLIGLSVDYLCLKRKN